MLEKLKPKVVLRSHDDSADAIRIWQSWEWGDKWNDAEMVALCQYLYGACALKVPLEWKKVLPREL